MSKELNVFTYDYLPWSRLYNWPKNISQFFRNIKYAWQRATKGYCDRDVWNLDVYLTYLLRDSIKQLADTAHGFPGVEPFDTPEKWEDHLYAISSLLDKSLDRSLEDFQYYKNPFEEEYKKHLHNAEFWKKYDGVNGATIYVPNKEEDVEHLTRAYFDEEERIARRRNADRDTALKLIAQCFDHLWD